MEGLQFCPVGGMNGILITMANLKRFAVKVGATFLDQVIPLPNVQIDDQTERIEVCDHEGQDVYWETDEGNHGWCCKNCGTVTQWG